MTISHIEDYRKPNFLLWLLCLIGSWSVFPNIFYLGIIPPSVSNLNLFFISTIQATLFFGLVCYLSYKIVPKTDLEPFVIKGSLKQL